MLVVVFAVGGVLVAIVNEVDVVIVLHGLVAAVLAVGVLNGGVLSDGLVLVVVVLVQSVVMSVVHVIGVVIVPDCLVAAVSAVLVVGDGVLGVNLDGAHDASS